VKVGDHIALLTQKDPKIDEPTNDQLFEIGCLAHVESLVILPKGFIKIVVRGISRIRLISLLGEDETRRAEVEVLGEPDSDAWSDGANIEAKRVFYKEADGFIWRNKGYAGRTLMDRIRRLPINQAIDAVAGLMDVGVPEKQRVLEQVEIQPRMEAIMRLLRAVADGLDSDGDIENKAQQAHDEGSDLSEKMRIIQEELGKKDEKDEDPEKAEFNALRQRIFDAGMSEEAQEKAIEELGRLEQMRPRSPEASDCRTYIDWLLALPWTKMAEESLDLSEAERILNEDHAGMYKVKERILEYLAVMRRVRDSHRAAQVQAEEVLGNDTAKSDDVKPEEATGQGGEEKQKISSAPPSLKGPILCLAGPPGVGKTSLARSIAKALNRPFMRFSLGGINGESEIRGHQITYISAQPGRIIRLLKKAGVKNPLMLLDELDKLGRGGWHGDPTAALLEVLDPEQNASFHDNFLGVGFDLSQVLFLCTANVQEQIPEALYDRLEVINLAGYTPLEKKAIAKEHLIPKSLNDHGLANLGIQFENEAIDKMIQAYTSEAGVRGLGREIATILRKLALNSLQLEKGEAFDPLVSPSRLQQLLGPEKYRSKETRLGDGKIPGVVNGLSWTAHGGEILTIEAMALPGKGDLKLTGKLGEVMQESAQIALSFVRGRAEAYGLEKDFLEKLEIHLHLPEGAIKKEGPSAGIAMATALVSALTGIPAKMEVAMTGELTLLGMVTQIGGLKEKLLAAHRMGRTTVLIPSENSRDLEDIPEEVKADLTIHLVSKMDEVIPLALTRMPC
jgi:ATP-dependent Lon protease